MGNFPPALFYKVAHLSLKAYWSVFRAETYGVRCLIECGGRILLVRHTYGRPEWTLPGGGLRRNEPPERAVRREVLEEVGIEIPEPQFLGEYGRLIGRRLDRVKGFHVEVPEAEVRPKRNEIREAAWFVPGRLPADLSEDAVRVMKMRPRALTDERAPEAPRS